MKLSVHTGEIRRALRPIPTPLAAATRQPVLEPTRQAGAAIEPPMAIGFLNQGGRVQCASTVGKFPESVSRRADLARAQQDRVVRIVA